MMACRTAAIRLKTPNSFFRPAPSILIRRHVHSSRPRHSVAASSSSSTIPISPQAPTSTKTTCLSILPTTSVLRSYLVTAMSSSPTMLRACFTILRRMLDSKSLFMNPDRNPVLRWIFMRTFYAQFCAGETKDEVRRTAEEVKKMGYTGVILEYALEVLESDRPGSRETAKEIKAFRQGMLDTIEVATEGDFIGMKWSGLGREALYLVQQDQPPTPAMMECIHEICDAAKAKGTLFLPGAEEENMNAGIDRWTLDLQRKYNKDKAFMYNTYQAYLNSTPAKLAQHIVTAGKEGYIPGIKIVRGAYLLSEPKDTVRTCWEDTNTCYDGIVEALLTRKWNSILQSPSGSQDAPFPKISVMIASHNAESIRKAQEIRHKQAKRGEERIELAYAQLQGMADEISCELVKASQAVSEVEARTVDKPRPFKAATWGTLEECMNFLIRRACENQDAAGRTVETRKAMGKELGRRARGMLGLA